MPSFFDTNVVVYALDRRAGARHATALGLIERHLLAGSFVISTQVLLETYAVLTRKLGGDPDTVRTGLAALAAEKVVGADAGMVLRAIELSSSRQLSVWDSLIVVAAIDAGCDTLYSEDLQAGQRFGGVEVVNPFALAAHEPLAPALRPAAPRPRRRGARKA